MLLVILFPFPRGQGCRKFSIRSSLQGLAAQALVDLPLWLSKDIINEVLVFGH